MRPVVIGGLESREAETTEARIGRADPGGRSVTWHASEKVSVCVLLRLPCLRPVKMQNA